MKNRNKSLKIFSLYSLIVVGFFIFLCSMFFSAISQRDIPSLYTSDTSKAKRGSIISADGFHIATTKKLYKASVDTRYIDPEKKDLFIELFRIYSGMDAKEIRKKINGVQGNVVLSYSISEKRAQYLKKLAYELRRYKVFVERVHPKTGTRTLYGLNVLESGETRIYPYDDLLTPIIGYPHKEEENGYTLIKGVKGLEKKFDIELSNTQDALVQGKRDVNNYIILNKESFTKPEIDGIDVKITVPVALQIKIEKMLTKMKEELDAKEVLCALMDVENGNILSMASSNRFLPKEIKKSDYPSLNSSMIEYSFEPGSVIKPIAFALLLDKGLVNPFDMVNGFNGRYRLGKKIITDEHRFDWLSAENVIVHSSNIGIVQLTQKLSSVDFYQGLQDFGFSKKSTYDLIYEKDGSIPDVKKIDNEIYKGTLSYGYGMNANLMQLIRAYSVFNNNGRIIYPRLVDSFIDSRRVVRTIPLKEQVQIIKSSTASRMKKILIKTVNEGTGVKTKYDGLEVGGKTGTAHKVEDGKYVNKYNTSFIGFVNDKKRKFTMGVVVIEPKSSQFASQTAAPVFKNVIDILVEDGYLKPDFIN
ncbi:MAG: penicillin-binding protein 2 [Campylobacterales bacterium]|nr:penicillin-binding protein 2 [Campylobacterales bacterium]